MIQDKPFSMWIEIDLNALKNNIKEIRTRINSDTKFLGVVKFNAYGHDAVKISEVLIDNGIDALGVSSCDEGIQLRKAGINVPILIMNDALSKSAKQIVHYNLTPTVSNVDFADDLNYYSQIEGKVLGIHVRVDVSDSNIGVKPENFLNFTEKVKRKKNLYISGIFTHLVSAYFEDKQTLLKEIDRFENVLALYQQKEDTLLIHALSSPGIFKNPKSKFSMIRIGTGLYGLPSYKKQDLNGLKPIMQLKTQIINIGTKNTLCHMEYTGKTTIGENTKTALIPVGYGNVPALIRMKNGNVLVNGIKVPVLGGAFMGHMIIDITSLPEVKIGDEVVIFGKQMGEEITVSQVAQKCGIPIERCESICLIDKSVKRLYLK